jgi:hypothetical protein
LSFAQRKLLIIRSENRDFASFETASREEGGGHAPPGEGSFPSAWHAVPEASNFDCLPRRAGEKLVQITIRAMGYDLRLRRSLCGKAAML